MSHVFITVFVFFNSGLPPMAADSRMSASKIRLGWVSTDWKQQNLEGSRRLRASLACASLAVDAANARNGIVSSSLAQLQQNFTFTLKHGMVHGFDWHEWADQLQTFIDTENIDALLLNTASTYATSIADVINEKGIPAMLLGQTSPIFEEHAQKQWFQYFRMLPSGAAVLPVLTALRLEAGWTHMALVYDSSDVWSTTMAELINGTADANFHPSLHPVDAHETVSWEKKRSAFESTVKSIRNDGVRVVLCLIWTAIDEFESVLEKYEMLGYRQEARGNAYIALERHLSDKYIQSGKAAGAILLMSSSVINTQSWDALREVWAEEMPTRKLDLPTGVRITAQERRSLTIDTIQPSCYDAVVALAVAADAALASRGGVVDDWRETLTDQLAAGVAFASLAPYSTFAGRPWRSPELKDHIMNVRRDGQVVVENASDMVFPGTTRQIPVSFFATACTDVWCGHGSCVPEAAVGRQPGWCRCAYGFVGAHCDRRGFMAEPPENGKIDISVAEIYFGGFSQFADMFSSVLTVNAHFVDSRVDFIPGRYMQNDVERFLSEGSLWLPAFHVPHFKVSSRECTVHIECLDQNSDPCNISVETVLSGQAEVELSWSLYPFDVHTLSFDMDLPPFMTWVPPMSLPALVPKSKGDAQWELSVESISLQNRAVSFEMKVNRDLPYMAVRYFLPSTILVMVSWAGFFIKPTVLMPRFAAGFISFLAMISFLTGARDAMPDHCPLTSFDTYLSAISILMAFAVAENVTAQYLFEAYSENLAKHVDIWSRMIFPSSFFLIVLFLVLLRKEPRVGLAVTHGFLLLMFCGAAIVLKVETWFFPKHIVRRCILLNAKYKLRAANDPRIARLPWVNPSDKELGIIFSAMDKNHNAVLDVEEIESWVVSTMRSKLTPTEIETLRSALQQKFQKSVCPEHFKSAFRDVIICTAQVLTYNGDPMKSWTVEPPEEHTHQDEPDDIEVFADTVVKPSMKDDVAFPSIKDDADVKSWKPSNEDEIVVPGIKDINDLKQRKPPKVKL